MKVWIMKNNKWAYSGGKGSGVRGIANSKAEALAGKGGRAKKSGAKKAGTKKSGKAALLVKLTKLLG